MRKPLATILATMVVAPIAAVSLAAPASASEHRHDDGSRYASDWNSCHSTRANDYQSTGNYWGCYN
jgi:hypothetical protein